MEAHQGKEATGFHSEKHQSEERKPLLALKSEGQAVAKPSEAAKSLGIPNNVIVLRPAVEAEALCANRSSQESR